MVWNARGLYSKLSEFKNYLYKLRPLIVAVTETHMNSKFNPRFTNYKVIRKDREDGYGGLAIIYHQSVTVRVCNLTSHPDRSLETLGIQYDKGGKWETIALTYNPCKSIKQEEFEHLFQQVGDQGIVCGDFNAHHNSWEDNTMAPNPTGRALYNSLAASATLTLMNPIGMPTRIDPSSGKASNLDLIITTSGYQGSKVTLGEDLGSDHIPVLLSTETKVPDKCHFRPRWRIDEDNWMDWQQVIGQQQEVPDTA